MVHAAPGALDAGFGSGGTAVTSLGTNLVGYGAGVAVQPDGAILLAGYTTSPSYTDADFTLVRYNPDGTLDTSFGSAGAVFTDFRGARDFGHAVAVQPDGAILVAGPAASGVNTDFAVARYTAGGQLDTGFGTSRTVLTDFGSGSDAGYAIVLQPDGQILVAGRAENGVQGFALARYSADGSVDTSFGSGGMVTTDFGGGIDEGRAAALQPDGAVLVAGRAANGADYDLAVARYEGNAFDVTPDAFTFADVDDAVQGEVQSSGLITISGLGTSTAVPVSIQGPGEYALNGGTTYVTGIHWISNGDRLNVRHASASSPGGSVTTALTVGGIMAPNGVAHVGAAEAVSGSFISTTVAGASGSSGGGSAAPLELLILIAALLLAPARQAALRTAAAPDRPMGPIRGQRR